MNNTIKIIPIEELFNIITIHNIQILTESGFQQIKHVYRHKTQKKIYSILTNTGFVQCTEDHSLVINNKETKPTELCNGDTVNQFPLYNTPYKIDVPEKVAYWCGFITACISEISTSRGVLLDYTSNILKSHCLEYDNKIFTNGIEQYQRQHTNHIDIKQDEYYILQYIATILDMAGIAYSCDMMPVGVIRITLGLRKVTNPHKIKSITVQDANDYVYDVETANHHFCGGIGNILLHNTDSLFLKNPREEQIKHVIDTAKKNHGVDLEVDKEYRYCVLSNRKKNYFGVLKEGWVDVKGLTGKKSHTPQFIKTLFTDITGILSSVQDQNEFELARNSISTKIAECAKRLEDQTIPMKELTFNIMLSRNLTDYTKTIPQHVRAARLLDNNKDIKRGTIISYVKTNSRIGVKPLSMAKPEDIDVKKYLEFMESTLDQIMAPLNMDFESVLGKPKQTSLDQFFYS